MREHFKELLAIEGVRRVMLFRPSGERVVDEFKAGGGEEAAAADWSEWMAVLGEAREAEIVCERGRVFMRRSGAGLLLVVMGPIAPSAVVRLHCDILLPTLRERPVVTGIRRFFKR
jgi:hypothetical protein